MNGDQAPRFGRNEAERHLLFLHPHGPWTLTAIQPGGGKTVTKTFFDLRAALGWAETHNESADVHISVARLRGAVNKKASKSDVEAVGCLWVDIDPPKDIAPADIDAWRESVVARLQASSPEPARVASSGRGVHAYWPLDVAMRGDDPADMAAVEACNRWLAGELGGDKACVNVDRILRLWGSRNLKPGRVPALATMLFESDAIHPISAFQQVEASASPRAGAPKAAVAVALPEELPPVEVEALRLPSSVLALIATGDNPDEPGRYPSRSEPSWAVTCAMVRAGYDDPMIAAVLLDPDLPIADHTREKGRPYVEKQIGRAREEVAKAPVDPAGYRVLDRSAPYETARRLHSELFPNSIHTNDDWLEYDRGAYRSVEDATIRSKVWSALDAATVRMVANGAVTFEPFKPGQVHINGVLDALKAVAHQPADLMAPPVWLDGSGPHPLEIIACRNGLLHVPTEELLPPTPRFFTRNALDLDFDPSAPPPREWLRFIGEVFPDPAASALLQDWFGYLLLPDVSQQKIMLLVGPTRSGKGVIQHVITALVGERSICAPSPNSLGSSNVGSLQPLIGATVAFLTDARFGGRSDKVAITANLLAISAGDPMTIDRKHKAAWTGQLAARLVIMSNELPGLRDNSEALANRFTPLILEKSFLGKEDHGLAARIIATELPGVLLWALEGWRRLRKRGRFVLPAASNDAIAEILDLGSPVAAFVNARCELGEGKSVGKEQLYRAYKTWCGEAEQHAVAPNVFSRDLKTATGGKARPGKTRVGARDGGKLPVFIGIQLRDRPRPEPGPSGLPFGGSAQSELEPF